MVPRYNRVNGTHVSENPYIIDGILRKEWGSDALVMSDWCVQMRAWHGRKLIVNMQVRSVLN